MSPRNPPPLMSVGELRPELISEWSVSKNDNQTLFDFRNASGYKGWWKCNNCSHEWQTIISNRTKNNSGCPECGNVRKANSQRGITKTPKEGKSLVERNPEIIKFWHFSNDLKVTEVGPGSEKTFMWLCDKGHSSEAMINSKVNGFGCKYCRPKNNSKIEALFREAFVSSAIVSNVDSDPVKLNIAWRVRQVMTVDIVGQLSDGTPVAIEYDGMYYHQQGTGPDRDMAKTKALLKAGYVVIRIRERDLFNLKIKHSNLLQISHHFKRNDLYSRDALVGDTVAKIETWLTSFIV